MTSGAYSNFIHSAGHSVKNYQGYQAKEKKNMIKTDSQVYMLELSDTGFKMTVINMFRKIDYQLENFNRCLKAIKLIKWTF